jgi:sugar-specific transcriptional regulator TrmB
MKELLLDLGLSKNEISVYIALVKMGQTNTTKLSREVQLHRGYIYDVLDSLKKKGLVSSIKCGRTTHFSATPPNNLLSYAEEKKEEYEQVRIKIEEKLDDFKSLTSIHKASMANLLGGTAGVKSIFQEMLSAKEILTYGANAYCTIRYPLFYKIWNKKRIAKKINLRIIYDTLDMENPSASEKYVKIKCLDLEEKNIANTIIYDDKVAIIIWNENPVVLRLESIDTASAYKQYFELLWKKAEKYKDKKTHT